MKFSRIEDGYISQPGLEKLAETTGSCCSYRRLHVVRLKRAAWPCYGRGLDRGHDAAFGVFLRVVSDEYIKRWGIKS